MISDPSSEIDYTKLKYVLYACKSRTDELAQVRSIPDQISDCMTYARRKGIRIPNTDIFKEEKSAKKPNQRPVFDQILKLIEAQKYDGILAWNPDRLARNMKEAGIIIDMIHEGKIKDLQFVTHTFTNDANGKMLLGMAFVISKQYSDYLSQKVSRGVRNNFQEGKTPQPKPGYKRNKHGQYVPDGNNFELIKEAWVMRTRGDSLTTIAQVINSMGYVRITKVKKKKIYLKNQSLSTMFRDPFYYGLLIQNKEVVNLIELYNFIPAITKETFDQVQLINHRKVRPNKPHSNAFYPLRHMVICDYCSHTCSVYPSAGRHKRYLVYDCKNPECPRRKDKNIKKTTRAKVVFNFIYGFLADGLGLGQQEYLSYEKWFTEGLAMRNTKIEGEISSNRARIREINRQIDEKSLAIADPATIKTVKESVSRQIEKWDSERTELQSINTDLEKKIQDPEADKMSLDTFTNLSQKAGEWVKYGNEIVKDKICRMVFSNLTVGNQIVTKVTLNEPFDSLLKKRLSNYCRGYWIRTSNLTDPIRAR